MSSLLKFFRFWETTNSKYFSFVSFEGFSKDTKAFFMKLVISRLSSFVKIDEFLVPSPSSPHLLVEPCKTPYRLGAPP